MKLINILSETLAGSFIDPKDPKYKKSVADFKKNLLAIDYEKKKLKKKKKKVNEEGKERFDWKYIKNNKIPLEPEERKEAMDKKCVWHPSNHDKPTCAIWKSKYKDGRILYGCNTHRACAIKKTLKAAINAFPFIKSTS
ncbi:MAG TPA: hypothetical protein VMZ91_13080 [Candidatus Paceibacterota bacterium]|nr:hypothetical protein [Candidatus Paceibacterota bacterium]